MYGGKHQYKTQQAGKVMYDEHGYELPNRYEEDLEWYIRQHEDMQLVRAAGK